GFKGNAYYYPWKSYNYASNTGTQNTDLYITDAYLSGGYVGSGKVITSDHTTDFTVPNVLAYDITATNLSYSNSGLCETSQCSANWAFHMTGYMIPPTTGNYTISLGYIDDLGIINMSAGKFLSENCCDNFSPTGNVDGSNTVKSIWSSSGPTGTNQISLYLYAGVAYPLEIFYVNRGALGAITLTYTDPSGVTSSDFSGIIYHYDDID
ncbi:hypothetical protein HANVADRAFT_12094, partial [Hanseniaspora valbyensis NRRL Y-1626]